VIFINLKTPRDLAGTPALRANPVIGNELPNTASSLSVVLPPCGSPSRRSQLTG